LPVNATGFGLDPTNALTASGTAYGLRLGQVTAPTAYEIYVSGTAPSFLAGTLVVVGNNANLTASSSAITSATFVTTGLALPSVPISTIRNGHCDIYYEMSDTSHSFTLGAGMSNTPTYLSGSAIVVYGLGGAQTSYGFNQTATTATQISSATTPGVTTPQMHAGLDFELSTTGSNPVVVTIYAEVSSGGSLVIEQGSHCYWVP
jgi:hypothetical protein